MFKIVSLIFNRGVTALALVLFLRLPERNARQGLSSGELFMLLDPVGTLLFVPAIICLLLALVSPIYTLMNSVRPEAYPTSNGLERPILGATGGSFFSSSCLVFFCAHSLQSRYGKAKQQQVFIQAVRYDSNANI